MSEQLSSLIPQIDPANVPPKWKDDPERYREFQFVHSPELIQLYQNTDTRSQLMEAIDALGVASDRDAAWFRVCTWVAEQQEDIEGALAMSERIADASERARFRVSVARKLVEAERLDDAKRVMDGLGQDAAGYRTSYEQALQKVLDRRQVEFLAEKYRRTHGSNPL